MIIVDNGFLLSFVIGAGAPFLSRSGTEAEFCGSALGSALISEYCKLPLVRP